MTARWRFYNDLPHVTTDRRDRPSPEAPAAHSPSPTRRSWLSQRIGDADHVDQDKIGIMGGSYGGYMVMAALTFAPEEFKVGVNIFGVTNWLRTLKSIPPWWTSFREALYAELGDPARIQ